MFKVSFQPLHGKLVELDTIPASQIVEIIKSHQLVWRPEFDAFVSMSDWSQFYFIDPV